MVIIRQEVPTGIQAAREVEASREGTKRWVRTASVSVIDVRRPALLTNAAPLTYVIPASFLAIPFYLIMQHYGLQNNLWSVIAAIVTFATPYAIFIFQEYGRSIPLELDESARIDGASPLQIYIRIYLPLMAPALVAVGTYALFCRGTNTCINSCCCRTSESMTVPVALAQFLNSDVAPWNYMMATAIISCPPADRHLLRIPQPHVLRPDDGRRQGLSFAIAGPAAAAADQNGSSSVSQ